MSQKKLKNDIIYLLEYILRVERLQEVDVFFRMVSKCGEIVSHTQSTPQMPGVVCWKSVVTSNLDINGGQILAIAGTVSTS